jgi:hypothetical protein
MKTALSYIMFLLAAAATGLAMPSEKRQNDVPPCVEGESASNGPYPGRTTCCPSGGVAATRDTNASPDEGTCIDQCVSKETAEGDPNFGGVCQGNCEGLVLPGPPTTVEFTCNCKSTLRLVVMKIRANNTPSVRRGERSICWCKLVARNPHGREFLVVC